LIFIQVLPLYLPNSRKEGILVNGIEFAQQRKKIGYINILMVISLVAIDLLKIAKLICKVKGL